MKDPSRLTATAAVRQIASGQLTPADLMEACLARIASREPELHAFAHFDPAQARAEAAAARPGRLHGVPIGVKDVIDVAGMPSGYGSPIWAGWQPKADAAAVAWARAAGASVIGKTATTEFATRKPGPTANPHNLHHTPGGSSSGSAAGVADFFFPLAFGTQTAGSVIRPAAYCGVVGYKPTFGLIDRHGMKVMSASHDTIGVMARGVADCALLAGAVSGHNLGDPDSKPGRAPHLGICRSPSWAHATPATQALLQQVTDLLAGAGARVEERELPAWFSEVADAHPVVVNVESARAMGWEMLNHRAEISDVLRERLDWGLSRPAREIDQAWGIFERAQHAFPGALEGLDAIVTPAAPGEAPEGLGSTGEPVFNYLWTSLHVPCVTVPAGRGPGGLPLGIQIVGRRGDDRQLLAWAQWVAAAIG